MGTCKFMKLKDKLKFISAILIAPTNAAVVKQKMHCAGLRQRLTNNNLRRSLCSLRLFPQLANGGGGDALIQSKYWEA